MHMTRMELSSAVELYALTTDSFKTACLSCLTALPIDPKRSPLDTLYLGVLGRGTLSSPSLLALNRKMDALYDLTLFSRNDRMGGLQLLGSEAYFLDPAYLPHACERASALKENIRILKESIYAPLFLGNEEEKALFSEYLAREKVQEIDYVKNLIASPASYARKRARELAFAEEPHGASFFGREEEILALSEKDVISRYFDLWSKTKLRFFYVGSTPPEEIASAVEREFVLPAVTNGERSILPPEPYRPLPKPTDPEVRESRPISQGKLVMHFSAGADLRSSDFYTAMVYNEIFGASPTSKLFSNVREKKSLCYDCSSHFDFYRGYFTVTSGIRKTDLEAVKEAILLECQKMAEGEIRIEELSAAKQYLYSVYTGLYDHSSSIENYFASRVFFGITDTPEDCIERISRITLADVVAYAETVQPVFLYFLSGETESEEDPDEPF